MHHVELRQIGDVKPAQVWGLDLLIVGSPTHGFGPTPATRNFLKRIRKDALKGVKVAAFDTRVTEAEIHSHGFILSKMVGVFGYAAPCISDRLKKKGGALAMPPEGCYVDGTEGELERAVDREYLNSILTPT